MNARASLSACLLLAACGEPMHARGMLAALSAPEDEQAGRRMGCTLGAHAGAGFAAWARAAGGLERLLQPPEAPPLMLMFESVGLYGGGGERFFLQLLAVRPGGEDGPEPSEEARWDQDPEDGAINTFFDLRQGEDGWSDGQADRLVFPQVPVLADHPAALELEQPRFSGELYAQDYGLSGHAVLSGYLSAASLEAALQRFTAGCPLGQWGEACAAAGGMDPAALRALLLELAGGWDAAEALSVCLAVEIFPI